jgi:hypothetical protein
LPLPISSARFPPRVSKGRSPWHGQQWPLNTPAADTAATTRNRSCIVASFATRARLPPSLIGLCMKLRRARQDGVETAVQLMHRNRLMMRPVALFVADWKTAIIQSQPNEDTSRCAAATFHGKLEFSRHAFRRAVEWNISDEEIREAGHNR